MAEAYIVAAARTAGGRKGGRLAGWHPADLAASVLDALVERTGVDPALIEDVIMGCVMQGASSPPTSPATRCWLRSCRKACRAPRRPPMRIVAAGAAFRRPGGDVRHHGHRDRLGRRSMTRVPMGLLVAAGQEGLRPVEEPEHRGALSEHPVQPVHRRRDDGGEVRPDQGPARRVRLSRATSARSRRPRPASSRTRSCRWRSPAPTARPTATTSTRASASTSASRHQAA